MRPGGPAGGPGGPRDVPGDPGSSQKLMLLDKLPKMKLSECYFAGKT